MFKNIYLYIDSNQKGFGIFKKRKTFLPCQKMVLTWDEAKYKLNEAKEFIEKPLDQND